MTGAIGGRVGYYRRLNGLSAQALADAAGAGLTRSVVANIENGRRDDVGVAQLQAIAGVLGVPLIALLVDITRPDERGDDGTNLDTVGRELNWVDAPQTERTSAGRQVRRQLFALEQYAGALDLEREWRERGAEERVAARRGLLVTVTSLQALGIEVTRVDLTQLQREARAWTEVEPEGD